MKHPRPFGKTQAMSLGSFLLGAALSLLAAGTQAAVADRLSLAGEWRFQLDRQDVGVKEAWHARPLQRRIQLPGALQNQGFGDDISVDTKWTGETGVDRWRTLPQYEKYRQPGNIKVPFFLQPEKHYVGAAWYQRDIEIPPAWAGRRVVLTLERPHWETRVWLDDRSVGTNLSLGTPHVYELGVVSGAKPSARRATLAPGKHTLTVRVDNRVLVEVGDWSHSVSDHTQGNWNGLVGHLEVRATSPVWVEDLRVTPLRAQRAILLQGRIGNATGERGVTGFGFQVRPLPRVGTPAPAGEVQPKTFGGEFGWDTNGGTFQMELPLGDDFRLWDEFSPNLHELSVSAQGYPGEFVLRFGLRDVSTTPDKLIAINGRPAFFRGTLECCIFPKTGYPPTDVEEWRRILRVGQAHGLNHLRFHSWCPPEAAFVAADELGFYYQVECGVWTQPGNGKAIDRWIYDESERIARAYGHHPSFVLFTHGNEPHGPKREEYLAQWVNRWKRDGRFLVTSGSAYPQLPENQYHVHYPCRGPHGWWGRDYLRDVEKLTVPVIVHEMGQWCVFPNFDEVTKYTGPLKPKNFDIFRDSLTERGLLDQWRDFLRASGKLQVLCYKEEIEAALRTPGISGVQLLDLRDFPGQGTALVGVLDPFWEGKGYVTPTEFRRFYHATVPLARLLKNVWTTDETLRVDVEVAHFGPLPLAGARTIWKLVDTRGDVVGSGTFAARDLATGARAKLGTVSLGLSQLPAPAAYRLVVAVECPAAPETTFENDWGLWLYPAQVAAEPPEATFTTTLDDATLARLSAGARVLFATDKLSRSHPKLGSEPIFWNRYMFNTQERQTLGLLIDPKHPALARFPTAFHQDWQWNDILRHARATVLDSLPRELRPIVQPIDDWNSNRRLGLLFECRVGAGRLLVCAADLSAELARRPAARQLRASLLAYAASDRFQPAAGVTADELTRALHRASPSTMVNLGARIVRSDSEDCAHGHTADKAIDGDPDTIWHTQWQGGQPPFPHEIVVDLQSAQTVRGFKLLPRQDMANGWFTGYEFYVGDNAQPWGAPAATGQFIAEANEKTVECASPQRGRFIRLVAKDGVRGQPWAAIAELDVLLVK
jgi:hypothetical protein